MNNIELVFVEHTEHFEADTFGIYQHSHTLHLNLPHDDMDPYSLFNGDIIIND